MVAYLCTEEVPRHRIGFHRRWRQGAARGAVPERGRHLRRACRRSTTSPRKWGEITDLSAAQQATFKPRLIASHESACRTGAFRARPGWYTPTSTIRRCRRSASVVVDVGAAGVCFPDLLLTAGEYQLQAASRRSSPAWRSPGWCGRRPPESGFTAGPTGFGIRRCSAAGPNGWRCPRPTSCRTPDGLDDAEAVCAAGQLQHDVLRAGRVAARCGRARPCWCSGRQAGWARRPSRSQRRWAPEVIAMVHRPQAAIEFVEVAGRRRRAAADRRLGCRRCKDHTDGRGVDLVVDPIGGEAFDDAVRVLATEGRLLVIGFAGGRHPDGQGQPAAAAQRQRRRRRLRRVRQPQARIARLGVRFGRRRSWSRPGCGRRHRCGIRSQRARGVAEPGRRRGARQGRAGAVMPARWLSTCSAPSSTGAPASSPSSRSSAARTASTATGPAMADDWRAGYAPAMERVRSGELPWTRIDDLHRMILDELLARGGHHVDRRGRHRPPQPRVAPARPVAGQRGWPDAAEASGSSSPRCRTATCRC